MRTTSIESVSETVQRRGEAGEGMAVLLIQRGCGKSSMKGATAFYNRGR
jgi:hypothetical protein